MAGNPYFKFYASDWLGSTKRAMMSPAERGAYIDLLCHQWADDTCSLPDDDEVLANLSGLGQGWLANGCPLVRRCFPKHPSLEGRIANPKLLKVRKDLDAWRDKSAVGGRKSAAAKKLRATKGGSTTVPTKRQPKGKQPKPQSIDPKKKEHSSCRALRFDEEDHKTAEWMFGLIRMVNPTHRKPNFDQWANVCRLMREHDGRTDREIRELFTWANQDEFWQANILSPTKLRTQWDQLTMKRHAARRRPAKPLPVGAGQRHQADAARDGEF